MKLNFNSNVGASSLSLDVAVNAGPIAENYGLGWVIQTSENAISAVWHNGSNTKWYAFLQMIPEKDIAVVEATDLSRSSYEILWKTNRIDRLV